MMPGGIFFFLNKPSNQPEPQTARDLQTNRNHLARSDFVQVRRPWDCLHVAWQLMGRQGHCMCALI